MWDILKCPCTSSTFPLLLGYKFPHFIVPLIPRPAASVHLSALPTFFGGANLRKHRRCRRHLHSRQYLSLSLLALSADARALFPLPSPLLTSELPTRGSRLPTSLSPSLARSSIQPDSLPLLRHPSTASVVARAPPMSRQAGSPPVQPVPMETGERSGAAASAAALYLYLIHFGWSPLALIAGFPTARRSLAVAAPPCLVARRPH